MKTKLYSFVAVLLVFSFSALARSNDRQVVAGSSLTDLGDYSIVKSAVPMVIGDKALATYELNYENARNPVQIGVMSEKKCITFLVRSAEVEVQYVCLNGAFGARKMDKKYRVLPDDATDSKLDKTQIYAQRVISQTVKSEKDMLGLIACYLPVLVEKQYHAQF